MALGAAGSADLARRVGRATALEARAAGIDVVLGPVLDVSSNPLNPIVGVRAFGEDPEAVSELGVAFIEGVQETGAVACAQHFPGHGDTDADSHAELPVILRGPGSLRALELPPFARAVEAGVLSVMTAHVALPSVTGGERIPASRSGRIVEGLLRGELGFDGLVVTDAMIMAGARGRDGEAGAVVDALRAGNDMILAVEDLEGAIEAVRCAVKTGRLEAARIEDARGRIERLRRRIAESPRPGTGEIGRRSHRELAREVAEASVTCLRNRAGFFPLERGEGDLLVLYRDEDGAADDGFEASLGERFPGARVVPAGAAGKADTVPDVEAARRVVVFVFSPVRAWRGVADLSRPGRAFLDALLRRAARAGVVSFGNPAMMRHFPWIDAFFCLYGGVDACRDAALRAVGGEFPPAGRLPVTIPGLYPRGWRSGGPGGEAPA
jgi:beta-N-acetylhexosaminidase